jgi:hypothetical protein
MMNRPAEPTAKPAGAKGSARRIVAAVILGTLVVIVLWIAAFSFAASLLIGTCVFVVIASASTASNGFTMALKAVAAIISIVLTIIAAVLGLLG